MRIDLKASYIENLEKPIAFVGSFTNKRKIAQRGCFIIFGEKKDVTFEKFCIK